MIAITVDTEADLNSRDYRGIYDGLGALRKILDKYDIKVTFFVTCDCIEKYPKIFQRLQKEDHEIALHGYRHVRFDKLSYKEKEEQIKKSIEVFVRYLKKKPKGFRAPQHSIDNETLNLLEKYNFKYDSSYTPLNLFQLFFFPRRFLSWLRLFLSKTKTYRIRGNLYEIPCSAIIIPFVSLVLRIFPKSLLKFYLGILKVFNREIVFYAHSWDFIELPNSRIDRTFSHKRVVKNLIYLINHSDKNRFVKMEELV